MGQRLLEATIEMSGTSKLEKIELSVYASNIPAIRLCRKLGFEEEGLEKRGRLVDGVYDDMHEGWIQTKVGAAGDYVALTSSLFDFVDP